MKTWILFALTIVITGSAVFSGVTLAAPGILQAYAGIALDPENAANSIIVHANRDGTSVIKTYDSFSRIGFVSGDANFLLESVPSIDKKEFYEFIKESLDDKNTLDHELININIDIYSGSGMLIETLEYRKCALSEYFVHSVDSLGKIQFIKGEDSIEIREVSKFDCTSFTINLDRFGHDISEKAIFEENVIETREGDLKYNTLTNTLQKYQDGEWVDISNAGGPAIQR